MYLIYSKDGSSVDFLTGHYRNPDYFHGCEKGATQVAVDAAFAHVADAYRASGVEVTLLEVPQGNADDGQGKPSGKQKGKKADHPGEPPQGNADETDAG